MPTYTLPFRRWSKRRQARALLVALADRAEWGRPERVETHVREALADGICPDCGTLIRRNTSIVKALHGPPDARAETWVHAWCPTVWETINDVLETWDDLIITKISVEGRSNASCGHDVRGRPTYLVRRPVSLTQLDHSYWVCEECVTR